MFKNSLVTLFRRLRGATGLDTSSDDERYFVAEAMRRRYVASADVVTRLGLIYHIFMFFVIPRTAAPEVAPMVSTFHLVNFLLILPLYIKLGRFRDIVRNVGRHYVLPVAILLPPLFYGFLAFRRGGDFSNPKHLLLINHIFSLCNFVILIHPGGAGIRFLSVLILSLSSFVAYSSHPVGASLAGFSASSMFIAAVVAFSLDSQSRAVARREFKLMIQAAPAKIVRQSASSQEDLAMVFSPTQRHCVCISSDWRGYQALTASVASRNLADALGAYYEMTDRLLAKSFPEGNYYTDWIADELFVVLFAKDEIEEKALINSALTFASDLIVHKRQFVEETKMPIQIDVGIASGLALIGMMGPSGHRKATALGDVPGQARRFQGSGKHLRASLGDHDRVIFGANTLFEISAPFDVQEFDLPTEWKMRDVQDNRIFYLEPRAERMPIVA